MQKKSLFRFEHSYLDLPKIFYSQVRPEQFPTPQVIILNESLCNELQIQVDSDESLLEELLLIPSVKQTTSFAQAYAGHQFGHFTKLGDGRAIVIGEHLIHQNQRIDIQLKGSGKTSFSRGGDGKATFKAMLREYIMSEAMHALGIPTSRSLSVIKTGEQVYRQPIQEGATLVRVMQSHIRVGTFQYAAVFGSIEDIRALTLYTAKRIYPEIINTENVALSLLRKVITTQIDLVVNWLRVGFIHGVMNTDNTSISGETFDYGPCAFMNAYSKDTVYSSIDHNGRYSFGNQHKIIKWNIVRLAEALLPIIDNNQEKSISLAQAAIDEFDTLWHKKYYEMMFRKIGIPTYDAKYIQLVEDLLEIMEKNKLDYTNTFSYLASVLMNQVQAAEYAGLSSWLATWEATIQESIGKEVALENMQITNPIFIPRNHLIEQALEEKINENSERFNALLLVLKDPYTFHAGHEAYQQLPASDFEKNYQTFCGT